MNHLMIDLETMGNGPYAPIVSIGAVFFDPNTGKTSDDFLVNVSLESTMRYRARPDASTILWWMEQDEAARRTLTNDTQELTLALSWLSEFVAKHANPRFVQVWGNGASFDCVILRNNYTLTGLEAPWQWWNDRDVRTVVEMGKAIGIDPKRDMPFEGTRHSALDDAIHQVKYVSAIWQKLIQQ
ncbi:TPA: 3'-5' exoribonuclease [Enterobacter hormaechei]|nr:3'-5' exoribonuclease [Enterobacter hormaechei]